MSARLTVTCNIEPVCTLPLNSLHLKEFHLCQAVRVFMSHGFRVLSTWSKRILGGNTGLSHAEGLLVELHRRLRVEVSIMQSESGPPPTPSIWDGDSNKLWCLRGSHSLQEVVFFWMSESESCSGHIAAPQCIVIPNSKRLQWFTVCFSSKPVFHIWLSHSPSGCCTVKWHLNVLAPFSVKQN